MKVFRMSDENPPSEEELKAMMNKAKEIADQKKAEQAAKVKSLDMDKHSDLEKHLEEKASKK